jgi:hypothetical protein
MYMVAHGHIALKIEIGNSYTPTQTANQDNNNYTIIRDFSIIAGQTPHALHIKMGCVRVSLNKLLHHLSNLGQ